MFIEAPLGNGQLYSWREIESYPPGWLHEANLPATLDLRGFGIDRVETALSRLVERHEPLRTTYHVSAGVPVQRIHSDLAPPVERVDRVITDFGDPDRTTTELLGIALPMTDSPCWRGVLVTTDNAPMFLSLSFSHLIVDVWSVLELTAQLRALLDDPDSPTPAVLAPRELPQRQQGGAERYWRRFLADDLVHQFPTLPTGVLRPRIQATLHSGRLGGLIAEAARRHGATAPAVLMALVAAGLSEHTGAERVAMSLMSSNRFAPEYQRVVATLNQLIPVVTDIDHRSTLAEHITRLHWAATKAYRYSGYDVDRIAVIATETGAAGEHDCWFNHLFQCWFNYLQLDTRACDPNDTDPAELVWTPVARQYGQPFDVRVSVHNGLTSVAIRTDPEVIPAEALTEILRSIAQGAQRAVAEPDTTLKDLWSARGDDRPALFPPAT